MPAVRGSVHRADQDKAAAEKALADARTALQTSTTQHAAVKKALEQATAAKVAAAKALDEKQALLVTAIARVQALKAEAEALAIEKKRADATRGGLASAGRPGS